jgi:DNA-binding transcriptional regulator YdaS (Cro superfamily)
MSLLECTRRVEKNSLHSAAATTEMMQQQQQQNQQSRPISLSGPVKLVKSFREKCLLIDERQIQRKNNIRPPPPLLLRSTSSSNINNSRINASDIRIEKKKSQSSRLLLSSGTSSIKMEEMSSAAPERDAATSTSSASTFDININNNINNINNINSNNSINSINNNKAKKNAKRNSQRGESTCNTTNNEQENITTIHALDQTTTSPISPRAQRVKEEFNLSNLNSSPTTTPLLDDDDDDHNDYKAYPLSQSPSSPTEDDYSSPSRDSDSYISSNVKSVSSSLPVLSPQSSQFANAAMVDNIHRAKEECIGLSKALSKFKKGSREYNMLKLKLDVARDELACMKEDYDMFVNFASIGGGGGDSGEETMLHNNNHSHNNLNDDGLPSLQLEGTNDTVGRSPNSVSSGILTPPLHTNNNLAHPLLVDKKCSRSRHDNFVLSSKEEGSNNANNRQELMDTKDLMMILENGVQKYSIEWFTIKSVMKKLSQMKVGHSSISIESMIEDATQQISNESIRNDVKNELLSRLRQSCQVRQQQQQQQQQQVSSTIENRLICGDEIGMEALTISGKDKSTKARRRRRQQKQGTRAEECNFTLLLEEVPKYSLEWFQIQKTLKGSTSTIRQQQQQ